MGQKEEKLNLNCRIVSSSSIGAKDLGSVGHPVFSPILSALRDFFNQRRPIEDFGTPF